MAKRMFVSVVITAMTLIGHNRSKDRHRMRSRDGKKAGHAAARSYSTSVPAVSVAATAVA